jgi:hypothetical protein
VKKKKSLSGSRHLVPGSDGFDTELPAYALTNVRIGAESPHKVCGQVVPPQP